jgi:hypothetical protein
MTASEECVRTLLKLDAFGTHAVSQPVEEAVYAGFANP